MSFDFTQYLKPWKQEKFVKGLPSDVYHAEPAVSSGQLKTILDRYQGIHKLYAERTLGSERKETEALRFGSMFHKAALEGPDFLKRYRVMPKFVGKTKDGRDSEQSAEAKAKKNAWLLDQPKGTIVVEDAVELDQISGMMNSLMAHPVAAGLLNGGIRELSGFFNYRDMRCRIRVDLFQEGMLMLNDLKTTRDAKKSQFQRQVFDDLLYVQAAFYSLGASKILGSKIRDFNFIAVEKEPPYLVGVHSVTGNLMDCAENQINDAMDRLKAAITSGVWLPEPQIAYEIEAPEWLSNRAIALEKS